MAYIMDTNDEERAKGKTVEVGAAPRVLLSFHHRRVMGTLCHLTQSTTVYLLDLVCRRTTTSHSACTLDLPLLDSPFVDW